MKSIDKNDQFYITNIKCNNEKLTKAIQNYSVYYVKSEFDINYDKSDYVQYLKQSKIAIINYYEVKTQNDIKCYFAVCFEKTILIFDQFITYFFDSYSTINENLSFIFLPNSKNKIEKLTNTEYNELKYHSEFLVEISNFNFHCVIPKSLNKKLYQSVVSCLSGYLIQKSYLKAKYNRTNPLSSKENIISNNKIISEDDFIELRTIGAGSLFVVFLIYNIENEQLYAIKKPNILDSEIEKLKNREINNYKQLDYPLLPKFYGRTINDYIITEYIHGNTLSDTDINSLSDDEKYKIIFEIMLIIEYLHRHQFIYRDLKPCNVIIDDYKNVVLIDFDRMIKFDDLPINENGTKDFSSKFIAPEVNLNDYSYSCDIYSLGIMIQYLLINIKNQPIESIIKECIQYDPCKRPTIYELIFYLKEQNISSICNDDPFIEKNIKEVLHYSMLSRNPNDSNFHFFLGMIYIERDIIKAIYYLTLASNNNSSNAQLNLGLLYYEGKYVKQDIKKSIYYFTLSANLKNPISQFNLGLLYFEGKYLEQDINKSIHYFSLAADQNNPEAQLSLGEIYSKGIYIERNINKAIKYYTLAANQQDAKAQFNLGVIYYEGDMIKRDINKSIYYFSLAASQKHKQALFNLGKIYMNNKYVARDVNKAIDYFSQASEQNHPKALLNLGLLYYEGLYITKNFNRALKYFKSAADQNDPDAQSILGSIYYKGEYIQKDIDKSIYYFKLAANQNNLAALFNLGIIYYDDKSIENALHYLTLAANQNHLESQYNIGVIYFENKNVFDINKSIHYLSLAANQNHINSQVYLGSIYYDSESIIQNTFKSIYYFRLAAEQNDPLAQYSLGVIFYEGKSVQRDINKSIQYYTLAAKQNYSQAQFNLGIIYSSGLYVKQNINKAIYYYMEAANQNNVHAQYNLGIIYYDDKYNSYDINKSIHYLTLAANQNHAKAQFILGMIYTQQNNDQRNIMKGIDFLMQSSKNRNSDANFVTGYFYHEGKYVKKDIQKAIHLYKEASSFNNQFAKNNLGIIYRNGIKNKIEPNIGLAISYFDEAARRFNDIISMYNLAHIYIYEDHTKQRIDESIRLLLNLPIQSFPDAQNLLCIALFKKHGYNFDNIIQELLEKIDKSIISKILLKFDLKELYQSYRTKNFAYDYMKQIIPSENLLKENHYIAIDNKPALTEGFYEGFGI